MSLIQVIKIAELVKSGEASLQTGPFGTQLKASDYVEHGVPVINVRNIGFGDIRQDNLEFLNEIMTEKMSAHKLKRGDIVFGRKGAVERHAFIKDIGVGWIQGSDCLRLRINSDRIDNQFVSYFFKTHAHQDWMQAVCSFGATMASLNQDIVKLITIPLPPLDVQRKIAGILSAYDDLIENNKRRIALLEKMAEELYREWFVRFRFPDWQQAEFEKGIPKGWELIAVEKAFSILGGGTPSKDNESYWKYGNVNWFTPSDITRASGMFLSESSDKCNEEGLAQSSAKLFPAYSVMMTSRATIGAIGINTQPAATNQGFITCLPNEKYPLTYLYHWVKLSKPYFEMLSTGATFAELSRGTFKRITILTPTEKLVKEYDAQISPLFKQMENLLVTNENLAKTKNALLPRLISGKLAVEDLAVQLPPSMHPKIA